MSKERRGTIRRGGIEGDAVAGGMTLDFARFAVGGDESWARHVRAAGVFSGIYVLVFSAAEKRAYVGQSRNVVSRLSTHRRHHSGLVEEIRIASCPAGLLDAAERAAISSMEHDGWMLTNKLLAGKPMGDDVVLREIRGEVVPLPWERPAQLVVAEPPSRARRGTQRQQDAYAQASKGPWFRELVDILGVHVAHTIPAATQTAGSLWTLSLLPGTGRTRSGRRLTTLSAGGLEIVRVHEFNVDEEGGVAYESVLNTARPADAPQLRALRRQVADAGCSLASGNYASVGDVMTIEGNPWDVAELIACVGPARDLTYRLVVSRMRAGNAALSGRGHHPRFARQVLLAAREASRGKPLTPGRDARY